MVVTVVAMVFSWRYIGMGVLPLFTGIGHIFTFLGQCFPPDFYDFPHTLDQALITVCMAVVGTALAAVLGLIVGFLAARNTTPHPAVRWLARGLIVLCRSIPDLVFAIIFVQALGRRHPARGARARFPLGRHARQALRRGDRAGADAAPRGGHRDRGRRRSRTS